MSVMAIDECETISHRLNSTYTLTIRLTDINDNQPRFSTSRIRLTTSFTAQSNSRFVKISPQPLILVDSDSYAVNSANFLNMNMNRARETLFENAIDLHTNVKFDDLECFKSFNLDLQPVYNASYVPLVVLVEQEADFVDVNYVKCRVSFWVDVELVRREVAATNRTRLEYRLRASDYGGSGEESGESVEIELDVVRSGVDRMWTRRVEVDAGLIEQGKSLVEFDFGGVELASISKLAYNEVDAKIKSIDYR